MIINKATALSRAATAIAAVLLTSAGLLGGATVASAAPTPDPKPVPYGSAPAATTHGPVATGAAAGITLSPIHAALTPADDNYANAITAPSYASWNVTVSDVNATTEHGEKRSLALYNGYEVFNSVWYQWKAPASGVISVSLLGTQGISGAVTDTALGVFTGSKIASAKRIAWNDDAGYGGELSEIQSVAVKQGTVYHFQIGNAGYHTATAAQINAQSGNIKMAVTGTYSTPSNDSLANARSEKGTNWTATGVTLGSTIEANENTDNPAHSGSPRLDSVWWKWTAAATGTINVTDTATNSNANAANTSSAYLAIFSDFGLNGFDEQSFTQGSTTVDGFAVYSGTTYYFQVGEVAAQAGGPVSLHVGATYTGPVISSISKKSGSHNGGTKLTITGSRLGGATSVRFGTGSTSEDGTNLKVVSNTKITVVSPSHLVDTVPVFVSAYVDGNYEVSAANSKFLFTFK